MFEDHHPFTQALGSRRAHIVFADDLQEFGPGEARKIRKSAVGQAGDRQGQVPQPVKNLAPQRPAFRIDGRDAVDGKDVPKVAPAEEHNEEHGDPEVGQGVKEEKEQGEGSVGQGVRMGGGIHSERNGDKINEEYGKDIDKSSLLILGKIISNIIPKISFHNPLLRFPKCNFL